MGISSSIKDVTGVITVQIEGFFTERFINLCKINNVKIWDIRQIVSGITRFKMHMGDFKKLKMIARKTKCKVKIKDKKGIYFTLFKYRKRKFMFIIFSLFAIFIFLFSTHIWQINIVGNEKISSSVISEQLKESGLYIGKSKIGLSKKDVVNSLRAKNSDISWAGIQIVGTTVKVEIIEKTRLDDKYLNDDSVVGDIVADKTGVITKIVAENGSAKLKENSYVEEGMLLIEGVITSQVIEPKYVHAKGIVMIKSEYVFEREYKYVENVKESTNKTKYTVGISYDNKENMLNYLNKNKKYDINKTSKSINLFGHNISFDLYNCEEYIEKEVTYKKEELISKATEDSANYLKDEVLANSLNATLLTEKESINDTENGIIYKKVYTVNEQIGKFVLKESQ